MSNLERHNNGIGKAVYPLFSNTSRTHNRGTPRMERTSSGAHDDFSTNEHKQEFEKENTGTNHTYTNKLNSNTSQHTLRGIGPHSHNYANTITDGRPRINKNETDQLGGRLTRCVASPSREMVCEFVGRFRPTNETARGTNRQIWPSQPVLLPSPP